MKPLYTPETFDAAKSRDLLPFECYHCHSTFYRTKNEIQKTVRRQKIKNPRRNDCKYCCLECSSLKHRNGKHLPCKVCEKVVYRTPKDLRKTKHTFCSCSCSATYHNTHKTTGCRRSKLEVWVEKQLSSTYPLLKIDHNKTDAINAELDIYIPSLKLAFELNGIFHYEPIYGPEKLHAHKSNDDRKFQACLEKNIELCVIDTSHQKKFTEKSSFLFWNIINDLILKKMGRKTEFESV